MAMRIVSVRLADMLDAIARIRRVLDGIDLAAFENDGDKRWLVERGLEIVLEASRHLTDDLKARQAGIPWPKVAEIGNVLRHADDRVAADIVCKLA